MNLELVGRDSLPTSETLKGRIEQKLIKIEKRLGQELIARVTVGRSGLDYSCTIRFSCRGHDFNANGKNDDLFKATDEAVAKINRQVKKIQHKAETFRHDSTIREGDEPEAAV